MDQTIFCENLKKFRLSKNYTQEQVANNPFCSGERGGSYTPAKSKGRIRSGESPKNGFIDCSIYLCG